MPMAFEHMAETEGYYDGEHRIEYELVNLEGVASPESSSLGVESMREMPKHDV